MEGGLRARRPAQKQEAILTVNDALGKLLSRLAVHDKRLTAKQLYDFLYPL
jgi:hypothetical protein